MTDWCEKKGLGVHRKYLPPYVYVMKPKNHSNCFSYKESIVFKISIPYFNWKNSTNCFRCYYLPNTMTATWCIKLHLLEMFKSRLKYNYMKYYEIISIQLFEQLIPKSFKKVKGIK